MKQIIILVSLIFSKIIYSQNILDEVEHHYADNNGVKIHYVTMGEGPLILMIHGFPDFWYTWRNQMIELAASYKVAAIDLRGYNKSDKPAGVENYSMRYLITDVIKVINDTGNDKAIIVGHDWGGAIAWQVAMWQPDRVEKLVVLSTPHPIGLFRELKNNLKQQQNSEYAIKFQKENAHNQLTAEGLASWVKDPEANKIYIESFNRSNFKSMLNYYRANFPKAADSNNVKQNEELPAEKKFKLVKCATLSIFSKGDAAFSPAAWNDTWNWIDNTFTLAALPSGGHFIMHDSEEFVTTAIIKWLNSGS